MPPIGRPILSVGSPLDCVAGSNHAFGAQVVRSTRTGGYSVGARHMNRRTLGISYTAVTAVLITAVGLASTCWSFVQDDTVHFLCVATWVMSGAALGLSQVLFVVAAFRMKSGGTPASSGVGRLDPIRTLVVIIAVASCW